MSPQTQLPIILYCNNNGAIAQSKDLKNHKGEKHIEWKYHITGEIVRRRDVILTKVALVDNLADVVVTNVASVDNLVDPFTKALTSNVFQFHVDRMGVRCDILWTWVQVGVYWELYAHISKYLIIIWNENSFNHTIKCYLIISWDGMHIIIYHEMNCS